MKQIITLLLLLAFTSSCIENPIEDIQNTDQQIIADFDFSTISATNISVAIKDNQDAAIRGVLIQLWDTDESDVKNKVIFRGFTNQQGLINTTINLPSALDKVIIETSYIGVPNDVLIPVQAGVIDFSARGGEVTSVVIQETSVAAGIYNGYSAASGTTNITYNYLGEYNSNGVPDNLEAERDAVSATLLEYINASLPESQPVPQYHPSYLANGKKTTLDVIELADVWVTFIHEGAGFRNAIGFYTYNTQSPPQSLNDITTVNIIFPNLSYQGSGGGLISGDKVKIGRFNPGTSIGLVLLADGWNGANSETPKWSVFADRNLNPEADEDINQHNVLLWDEENELFLLGFEDVKRDLNWCDQDFNDAIFFVTSNPVRAISTENVSPIDKPGTLDGDGDGINDILDEYPDDPTKAYDSYYPSSTTYGTFAFEDNWPDYGDYDFNDLVVDYQFKHILNSNNQVVQMNPTFKVRAIGAGYRNGFGFATDLSPNDISSVTGSVLYAGYTEQNSNGTEAGQTNAVIIASDNVHDLFQTSGFVNTEEDDTYFDPVDINLEIVFSNPQSYEAIGSVPYNPFLIVSGNRGREIHLPGYAPTDKVDSALFGTLDDNSDESRGLYYRSKTDLPWAIHLPESFDYPKEKADIREGHLRFSDWAKSSGFSYMDWYRDVSGYRSLTHLFKKQ